MVRKLITIFLLFFLVVSLLRLIYPSFAEAATLYFSPSSGTYSKGSTLKVNVYTNTTGELINAIQANISYPKDKLQFLSISTSGSVLSIIAEKVGGEGTVRIAGGNTSAFSGSKFIAAVYFKVLASSGNATLSFLADSAVVKSADNQNALTSSSTAKFSFVAEEPEPSPQAEISKPPKISDVRVENLSTTSASIVWKTDMESTSAVEFGLTPSLGLLVSKDNLVLEHFIEIPSGLLLPGTKYYFRVISRSADLETTSETLSFTTKGYRISIKVESESGEPITGAGVTLYTFSDAINGITDSNGVVEFLDVSPGKHLVNVKYRNLDKTQEIDVTPSESQEFSIKIASQKHLPNNKILAYIILILVGILTISVLIYMKFRRKTPPPINIDLTSETFENKNAQEVKETPGSSEIKF